MFEVVAVDDREDGRASVSRRDIAINHVVVAGILRGELECCRSQDLDDEVVIHIHVEVGEGIAALRIGCCRGDLIAKAVEQIDGHVLKAWLAFLLQTIAIAIVPDEVADVGQSSGRELDDIRRGRCGFLVADVVRRHDEELVC